MEGYYFFFLSSLDCWGHTQSRISESRWHFFHIVFLGEAAKVLLLEICSPGNQSRARTFEENPSQLHQLSQLRTLSASNLHTRLSGAAQSPQNSALASLESLEMIYTIIKGEI